MATVEYSKIEIQEMAESKIIRSTLPGVTDKVPCQMSFHNALSDDMMNTCCKSASVMPPV